MLRRLLPLFLAAPLAAQAPLPAPIQSALQQLERDNGWLLERQVALCEIPAPSFQEGPRGRAFAAELAALGLTARVDAVGNVIAERRGRGDGATVVLAAHLDTVFPEGTDVRVRREGSTFHGPGIADDCRGLAILLAVTRALGQARVETEGRIVFVATVGEEGLGNLRGVRHLFDRELTGRVDAFITVDVSQFQVVRQAPGSHRYAVTFRGPGGHSFQQFGMPNPIHAAGRALARIADFQVPATPKTTFNVGTIVGGRSVNAIPDSAAFTVEWRSESPAALAALDAQLAAVLDSAVAAERARWPASTAPLTVTVDTLGIRPAGATSDTSRLVRTALATARRLGATPGFGLASTDANLPMSRGIPAIAIGHGGGAAGTHSLGETYTEGPTSFRGPQWALLLVTELAGVAGARP